MGSRPTVEGSVNKLGDDSKLLSIAPDLAGLIRIIDLAAEAVAAPCLAWPYRALADFPCAAAKRCTGELAAVDPHGQHHVGVIANEGVNVAELAAGATGKAVAILNVAIVRQVARSAAEWAGNSGIAQLGDGHGWRWVVGRLRPGEQTIGRGLPAGESCATICNTKESPSGEGR